MNLLPFKAVKVGTWFKSDGKYYVKTSGKEFTACLRQDGTLCSCGEDVEVEPIQNPLIRMVVLEEQLRRELLKIQGITHALLGEDDVREGTVQAGRIHDGGNPGYDPELRI